MIRIAIILFIGGIFQIANAQVSLQSVLDSITANNLQIKASSENREAEAAFARIGLNPVDPQVEYGYFPGNKTEIGTKTTLNISQSFYFPTVYTRKRTGAKLSDEKSGELHRFNQRYILIEAASHYIELVYLDKYVIELKKRAADAENVKTFVEKRLQTGDANQLEVNKASIEAMRWANELSINTARRAEKVKLLIAMNGDKSITLINPEYPLWQLLPVDSINSKAINNDPVLKAMDYDQLIAANNVKLQQSLWLPQFKAGYGQETILDGSYRGVQAGISIPLWQNKNTIKYASLHQLSTESSALAYRQQLQSTITAKYQVVASLKNNVDDYQKLVESIKSQDLLQKSLQSGNISVLEYYRELSAWYETYDRYLVSARDYYLEMLYMMQYEW
jgi:outer membrane protein, heavy metal efflux system